ncbi:MAG: fatty acid desaturase [Candidatus Eisenbacteria bacterium]
MNDAGLKKPNHYAPYKTQVAAELKRHLTTEELRQFHRLSPARHFAVVTRHVLLTLLTAVLIWRFPQPWIWLPLAFIQGFHILGYIILLHEQVHDAIFDRPHPRVMRLLGLFYAFPSAISATQFERWHLDHHAELGSASSDPKRAYLTPKIVARWYKALYLTPALFVIYSIAAAKEARTYPRALQRRIAIERIVNIALHLAILAGLWKWLGPAVALRVHVVPLFFFFPVAFTLNRLGQHYDIDPKDPIKWSTLVNPSPGWNFLMLWSNLHLEHHYYPRVPFYKLAALNRRLQPFYREHGVQPRNYRAILFEWFVKNRAPHTNWFEGPLAE